MIIHAERALQSPSNVERGLVYGGACSHSDLYVMGMLISLGGECGQKCFLSAI